MVQPRRKLPCRPHEVPKSHPISTLLTLDVGTHLYARCKREGQKLGDDRN